MPEEILVILDATDVDNQVSEYINTGDGHLPGSTLHRMDSTKSVI